jgi:hypothetical protein
MGNYRAAEVDILAVRLHRTNSPGCPRGGTTIVPYVDRSDGLTPHPRLRRQVDPLCTRLKVLDPNATRASIVVQ